MANRVHERFAGKAKGGPAPPHHRCGFGAFPRGRLRRRPRSKRSPAQAEVSVGTIYNYYQNKGDILGAIVSMEVNEVLNAGRGVVASPPANVGDALDTLIGIYIEHSLHYLSKEMWRQAMAISTQLPDSPFGQAYSGLDRALTEQICALIARLQQIGLVRADIDGRGVGRADLQQHEHDVHRVREARRGEDPRTTGGDTKAEPHSGGGDLAV